MSVMMPRRPGALPGPSAGTEWSAPPSSPSPAGRAASQARGRVLRIASVAALIAAILVETLLLLAAVIPTSIWAAHGYPNGPIPSSLYPIVAGLFYVLPTCIGLLCRRWPAAVVLATLPAWVDLAAFAVAASPKLGPFYFVLPDHSINTVGTLELFAILGALGWMARTTGLALLKRGEWGGQ